MEINRDKYLNQLIDFMWDGQVKVITGIRRCGKSYLLRTLFRKYLLENNTDPEHIISIELDLTRDIKYRNPLELSAYIRSKVEGKSDGFIFLLMKYRCLTKFEIRIILMARK